MVEIGRVLAVDEARRVRGILSSGLEVHRHHYGQTRHQDSASTLDEQHGCRDEVVKAEMRLIQVNVSSPRDDERWIDSRESGPTSQ